MHLCENSSNNFKKGLVKVHSPGQKSPTELKNYEVSGREECLKICETQSTNFKKPLLQLTLLTKNLLKDDNFNLA